MSLMRKGSKASARLSTEDFTACMDQKNAIISSLQTELETLRTSQEKFSRVKEQLSRSKARYQGLLKDHQTKVSNNQQRLELSVRGVYELRSQTEQLGDELRIKISCLKQAKFGAQQLEDFQNQKEEETSQRMFKLQEQIDLEESRRMEQERAKLQIGQVRQQVEKGRRENLLIRTETEAVNQKCYKTQSYIRNLLREQANLTENLAKIEYQNDILDSNISELDTAISINQNQISNKDKDCQQLHFHIASKALGKKKVENQLREKLKQLSAEKDKWKNLSEEWEQARYNATRLETLVGQTSSQINFIISKNNQISEINEQLTDDFKVCQRHLENVARVNKCMETEIKTMHETNLKAITKLRQPFSSRTNADPQPQADKEGASCRGSNFDTGDFDRVGWE